MNYTQALEYIHTRRAAIDRAKNLERFSQLLELLGNPQKKLRFAHIAGSSGKGSTAAMIDSICRAAGYKTGLFLSPFVHDFRERIQINGQLSPENLIVEALEALIPALDQMAARGLECSEFDVVTALAFMIFEREECEIVALEVGIGGLFDRTNVIDSPEVAVICSISLEHTELLGHTIAEIARHKCGIIKPGGAVAAYPELPGEALEVLQETCNMHQITPLRANINALTNVKLHESGSEFEYMGEKYAVSLAGGHQVKNALTAICAALCLREREFEISQDAIKAGLGSTRFVGRMQTVRQNPDCIIDGAHNPEKIAGLCAALDSIYPGRPIVAVMGMKADKDYESCIPPVARRSAVFVAVTPSGMGARALSAETTAQIARQHCGDVRVCEDAVEAGRLAAGLAKPGDLVLACGSMYIIGDVARGFMSYEF